jgi:hypothetical protein
MATIEQVLEVVTGLASRVRQLGEQLDCIARRMGDEPEPIEREWTPAEVAEKVGRALDDSGMVQVEEDPIEGRRPGAPVDLRRHGPTHLPFSWLAARRGVLGGRLGGLTVVPV